MSDYRLLTELMVEKAKPRANRYELPDGPRGVPGFALRVTERGVKTFVLRYRINGVMKRWTVGRHPIFGLAEARARAREALAALAKDGIDPAASQRPPQRDTLAAVLDEYAARRLRHLRRGAEVKRALRRELSDHLARPVRSLGRRDVLAVLDAIADRGSPIMANRVRSHLGTFFGWCVERGMVDASPMAGVKAPARERTRDRVLDDDELAAVWRASEALGWPFGAITRLLILTGQRRDEVARMAWRDLDLGRRLWVLPRELTKADRLHEVALSDLAVEVLEGLPRLGDGLVFPANRRGSANPVSGFSKVKHRLDVRSGVEGWRFHDLRRTAASGMARLGHPPHVVAAILNHSPGAAMGITAIYNRHRYGDEKRAALDAWAREVGRIVGLEEATVVELPRRVVGQ